MPLEKVLGAMQSNVEDSGPTARSSKLPHLWALRMLGLLIVLPVASCGGPNRRAVSPSEAAALGANPDMQCAIALATAGGAAQAAGDVDGRRRYQEKIQFFLGRVSVNQPDTPWFSDWRRHAATLDGAEQQKRLQQAQTCVASMAATFRDH
jgi:hypothetical protein